MGDVDKFNGLAIFLDTYANGRHNYDFPRIVAMMGDGQTSYDQAHDGDETNIAACSVRVSLSCFRFPSLLHPLRRM